MENQKMYMHIETGSVDTADGWIFRDEETGKLCDPVASGSEGLLEVVRDEGGEWVGAETDAL